MLFGRLHSYGVYSPVKEALQERDINGLVFVKEGWSWWAVLFQFLWTGYHRLWKMTALLLLTYGLLKLMSFKIMIPFEYMGMVEGIYLIWIGLSASDWRAQGLQQRGYQLYDVVMAQDESEALRIVLNRHLQLA